MSNKPQIILCPYCGNTQTTPDRCDECGGRFAPRALRATQIGMGPWYIRDKSRPFRPGCSYQTLSKLIETGKVKGTTIIRGPTTRQYWSLARNVAGVAHLVGYCHRCNAHVERGDVACHDCATMFLPVEERNELGLQFPTCEAADAARQVIKDDLSKRAEVDAMAAEQVALRTTEDSDEQIVVEDDDNTTVDALLLDDVVVTATDDGPKNQDQESDSQSAPGSAGVAKKSKAAVPPQDDDLDSEETPEIVITEPDPTHGLAITATIAAKRAATTGQSTTTRTPAIMWAMIGLIGCLTATVIYMATENSWYARQYQADSVRLSNYNDRYQRPQATRISAVDPARYTHDGSARYAELFEQAEYLSWPEPLAVQVAAAEALAKIGRPHEALIKLKEIEMTLPVAQRPQAIDRAIGVLEQHVSAVEVPTFFGIPVE